MCEGGPGGAFPLFGDHRGGLGVGIGTQAAVPARERTVIRAAPQSVQILGADQGGHLCAHLDIAHQGRSS